MANCQQKPRNSASFIGHLTKTVGVFYTFHSNPCCLAAKLLESNDLAQMAHFLHISYWDSASKWFDFGRLDR